MRIGPEVDGPAQPAKAAENIGAHESKASAPEPAPAPATNGANDSHGTKSGLNGVTEHVNGDRTAPATNGHHPAPAAASTEPTALGPVPTKAQQASTGETSVPTKAQPPAAAPTAETPVDGPKPMA